MKIEQSPVPGTRTVAYRGDTVTISLVVDPTTPGTACVRTNIAGADQRREEIVDAAEKGTPMLSRDWHDLPMVKAGAGRFTLVLPLGEVGAFEAKAWFRPEGSDTLLWPDGDNIRTKVEPAWTCCANTLYAAFVRQFGPNKTPNPLRNAVTRRLTELDKNGYSVIGPSGTFRDLVRELDFIVGQLHARIIQLLPVHPVPTTYGRMGRYGSPFAALDYFDVDPALAEFDRRTTPLEQFVELVDEVHRRGARLFMDIPANHTGWASRLQIERPEWFTRDEEGRFESPGAWGVTWGDLSRLDFSHRPLWQYMAEVFLFWCARGVDGFRCDAGYMVPADVWRYIVARVRMQYPDTVFILEGLGGDLRITESLLESTGLDWAYSELFQIHDRSGTEKCIQYCEEAVRVRGLMVHYAETHDNNRLASVSPTSAKLRTAVTALCSHAGGFGITAGVEWLCTEKVMVHEARSLNWGQEPNLASHIQRLNALVSSHPCFWVGATLEASGTAASEVLIVARAAAMGHRMLIVCNLDAKQPVNARWKQSLVPPRQNAAESEEHLFHDVLTGRTLTVPVSRDEYHCSLVPGEVLCLSRDRADVDLVDAAIAQRTLEPQRSASQRLRATVLDILRWIAGPYDMAGLDPEREAEHLRQDPRKCIEEIARKVAPETFVPVVRWRAPRDAGRVVMLPPSALLLVESPSPFRMDIGTEDGTLVSRQSLQRDDGLSFAVAGIPNSGDDECECRITVTVYGPEAVSHCNGALLLLPERVNRTVPLYAAPDQWHAMGDACVLCTNGRAAMAQVRAAWGETQSKYDALLAANLHPAWPVDRTVLFTRLRMWLVRQGYSQQIDSACQTRFVAEPPNRARWDFLVPAGQGCVCPFSLRLEMVPEANTIHLVLQRGHSEAGDRRQLDDGHQVRVILRPDIEHRSFHSISRAESPFERGFASAIEAHGDRFAFAPGTAQRLEVHLPQGQFTSQPEWVRGVPHPVETQRGLEDHSDLFSPGYFEVRLDGGAMCVLTASAVDGENPVQAPAVVAESPAPQTTSWPLRKALLAALRQFVVQRDDSLTVIAGYPWFLDWGRDTLICLRGIIAAGLRQEAEQVLVQFARFESDGTLPNMIRGDDVSNRDTSDAPLWFLVAAGDLFGDNEDRLLQLQCGDRTMRDVMRSIGTNYMRGTPNGIRMDPSSGLIYSPTHFTWMDTNHPAGSPRQGYPIEIQALWFAGLQLLNRIDLEGPWGELAAQVRGSVMRLYAVDGESWLADCLHAREYTAASEATRDDALRPNQLLAVTLGLVDDAGLARGIVDGCEELLVPGGIRSLADRPVTLPLPVVRDGALLNDPTHPYWGRYGGDEDTRRKPAYHNGTAWTWQFPLYCEALPIAYGPSSRNAAMSLLMSARRLMQGGTVGQIPEILDGDAPHTPRGCGAQAWGVSEFLRVLTLLERT